MHTPPPATVADAFSTFDENLKLDPDEHRRAIELHNEITDQLKAQGTITGGFLQGSLARKTMLAPLRNIDKVLLIAWNADDVGPGSACRAAETVAAALSALSPSYHTEIGKHCVKLVIEGETFTFDAVVAIDLGDDVLIIDTEQDRWEVSNTRTLIRLVQGLNQKCNGRWVRQVRFVKSFVRFKIDGRVPGLHVESFAKSAVSSSMSHDAAVAAVLRAGADALAPGNSYYDPTGVDRLDTRLEPSVRAQAHRLFDQAASEAAQALELASRGEHNAAIAIWHSILGDNFAKPDEGTAFDALGRGAGVGTVNVITRTAQVRPPETRAWRAG